MVAAAAPEAAAPEAAFPGPRPSTLAELFEGTLHLAVSVPSSNSGPLRLVRCCENLDGVLQAVAET